MTAPATDAPTAVAGPTLCRCSFSTLPGKELVCAEAAGHPGPHHVDGVTWTQLFPDPRPALSYGCTCPGGDQHDPANTSCRYGQVAAVRPPEVAGPIAADLDGDFYEDDEPASQIQAILERPPDGVTGPPAVCRCGHDLDRHTGSFTTGQHCKACPAWEPCACCEPPAYTPPPVNATPVTLAAARGAVERANRLEAQVQLLRGFLQDVVDKATPHGEIDEPGGPYVAAYLLPTGSIHRALAYLRDGAVPLDLGAAPERQYRCIGKPTTTDNVGRVVSHKPSCGWEGPRPEGAHTFCPQCGGWLDLGAAPEEAGG